MLPWQAVVSLIGFAIIWGVLMSLLIPSPYHLIPCFIGGGVFGVWLAEVTQW